MTTRELPYEEWAKLAGTELADVWPALRPEFATITVVEDAGEIIGCCAEIRNVIHAHGWWIAPEHRGKGAVLRKLRAAFTASVQASGARAVITSALDDNIAGLLEHMGAEPIPGVAYRLPMEAR